MRALLQIHWIPRFCDWRSSDYHLLEKCTFPGTSSTLVRQVCANFCSERLLGVWGYPEFSPQTMWSLSNAFTSEFKKLDPIPQSKATAKLGEFLDQLTA